VLDPFTRANGVLGSNWAGTTAGYSIASNQVDVAGGGDIFWKTSLFGAEQEVYITLTTIDQAASEIDLLLKAQNSGTYTGGVIEVLYSPSAHSVQIWTYAAAQGWVQRGADIPVTFVNGDRFGAHATANGQVKIYQNGTLLASRDISSWTFAANGGYIGLWFDQAGNALFDDFGGG
jgi:hypothetical protein